MSAVIDLFRSDESGAAPAPSSGAADALPPASGTGERSGATTDDDEHYVYAIAL